MSNIGEGGGGGGLLRPCILIQVHSYRGRPWYKATKSVKRAQEGGGGGGGGTPPLSLKNEVRDCYSSYYLCDVI